MEKILLIMTNFYGYKKIIINEITKNGYEVHSYDDDVKMTTKERIYNKLSGTYHQKKFDKYFDDIITKEKETNFSKVLIIFGALTLKKKHIAKLKETFKVPIIYYAWDSVENFENIKDLLLESDVSYSFDPIDSKKYNVGFLPLFYVQSESNNDIKLEYDVSTVMSIYSEKVKTLSSVVDALPNNINKNIYLKVRDKVYLFFKIIFFNHKYYKNLKKYIKTEALPTTMANDIFLKSKTVIDCPLPNQNGLTMRTFEVLSKQRKLITTNKNIKQYDFYNENNIFIVESDEKVPLSFFESDFDKNSLLSEKYSVQNFVKTLLGGVPSENIDNRS